MKNENTIVDVTINATAIFKLLAFLPAAYELARIYHAFFGESFRSPVFESWMYAPWLILGLIGCFGASRKPFLWILALSVLNFITKGQYGDWQLLIDTGDAIASTLILTTVACGGIVEMFYGEDLPVEPTEGIKNDER